MKYLFFDIECSNCFNGIGKMCEFGYVLCDENLNVMKKGDIPMSPGKGEGNKFHLRGRKNEKDLELAYEYDYYFNQPEFPFFYNQIKRLMEEPGTICFAFSMDNDIPHLYNACARYKLAPMNYICYDVQKLAGRYLEKKGQISLKNACLEIVGPHSLVMLQEHLSRDDAMMEKMIFDAICLLQQTKPAELLVQSNFAKTNSLNYMNRIKEHAKRKREKTAGHDLYRKYIIDDDELDKAEYAGKRYNVSAAVKSHLDDLKRAIDVIKSKDGIFSNRLDKTDYFVVLDEKNKEEIIKATNGRFSGEYVMLEELLSK